MKKFRKSLTSLVNYRMFAYSILISGIMFTGCGDSEEVIKKSPFTKVEGGKYRGGVFHLNETEYIRTLFPQAIVDASSYRTAGQVFEGLLKFNQQDLKLIPGLAEALPSIDSSGTIYTFKLRKGVKFHPNSCFANDEAREVKAEDVKYCFTMLCTAHNQNNGFSTIFKGVLKGADKYFDASKNGKPNFDIEGIKVIDDYTIQLILNEPSSVFKYHLAGPYGFIFAKEAYDKYGLEVRVNPVGTGPFMIQNPEKDVQDGIKIILKKNPDYYGMDEYDNQLPLLDALEISFMNNKRQEMTEFTQNKLQMIYRLPSDIIIEILKSSEDDGEGVYQQYQLQRQPEMATHMLAFLTTDDMFKDKNLRKALAFAVDRKRILEYVLEGEGDAPGYNGVTPNTFRGYRTDKLNGYSLNTDSSLKYFNMTKYRGDVDFPKLSLMLNPDGERNMEVAEEVQHQLKDNLSVEINIDPIQRPQLVEKMINGQAKFFRLGWFADYPHPQAFLSMFYGKNVPDDPEAPSYPNLLRYKNSAFDELYEKGMRAGNDEEAFEFFLQAEQVLLDDCPFIILWYDEGYRLLQPYVKDFPSNPMQYRDFSKVYFDKDEMLKKENAEQK